MSPYIEHKFKNHWGRQFQLCYLPSTIVMNGVISLSPRAIKVLAVLYYTQKHQVLGHRRNPLCRFAADASAKVGTKKLMERTGYFKNIVTKAVDELEMTGYVRREPGRKKYQEFGVTTYVLLHPETREPMAHEEGKGLLYANRVRYFAVPTPIVNASQCDWSMGKLSSSEWLYIAVLYSSARRRSLQLRMASSESRQMSGLSPATFKQALCNLFVRGLIWVSGERELQLEICDPHTASRFTCPMETMRTIPRTTLYLMGGREVANV